MSLPSIEKLPIPALKLGEGPHWSAATASLYFVCIEGKTVYRYHPESNKYFSVQLDVPYVGFIVPVSGTKDQFVIGAKNSLHILKWDGESSSASSLELLQKISDEPENNRINDGKCDPFGRLWFGTMTTEDTFSGKQGSLYSFTKESGLTKHYSEIGISNGLSWNLKKNLFYYIDSLRRSVDSFDYKENGTAENRRVVFDLQKNNMEFFPDGMTIDAEGKLWVACFTGSRVLRIDPDKGVLLQQIDIPTPNVTSVAWGGPDLADLYVTTAGPVDGSTPTETSGCLFRVRGLSTKGLPMDEFKL